jgi:hypothetical protein
MLTEARVDEIFAEMNGYILELASEPGMLGPQYFQDIIAKCRGYLNQVSLVLSELSREKLEVSSDLRRQEALYSLEYDNLLANDITVKALANIEDRKSTVGYMLRLQRRDINGLKDRMHALDSVYKVVGHRNRELHATMNAIKDQKRLMVVELSTGAYYGDERVPKSSGGMMVEDFGDFAALLDEPEADAEPAEVPVQEKVPQATSKEVPQASVEQASTSVDDEAVLRFLDGGEAGGPKTEPIPPAVAKPFNEDSAPTSEADDFFSLLDGL